MSNKMSIRCGICSTTGKEGVTFYMDLVGTVYCGGCADKLREASPRITLEPLPVVIGLKEVTRKRGGNRKETPTVGLYERKDLW